MATYFSPWPTMNNLLRYQYVRESSRRVGGGRGRESRLVRPQAEMGRSPQRPDRFFAKDGRVVLIEFKRVGKGARSGQARELDRLRAAGVEVYVVDNPLTALRILEVPYA